MIPFHTLALLLEHYSVSNDPTEFINELVDILKICSPDESARLIYLCTGRIGVSHAPRIFGGQGPSIIDLHLRFDPSKIQEGGKEYSKNTVSEVYEILHRQAPESPFLYSINGFSKDIDDLAHQLNDLEIKWLIEIILGQNLPEEQYVIKALVKFVPSCTYTDSSLIKVKTLLRTKEESSRNIVEKAITRIMNSTMPDIGVLTKALVQDKGLNSLITFFEPRFGTPVPLEIMDLFHEDQIPSILKQLKTEEIYVQAKSDGIYIQIHKYFDEIHLFDEIGSEITSRLPDIIEGIKKIPVNLIILDGEVVGIDPEKKSVLRKEEALGANLHQVIVFDLIKLDDEDYRLNSYSIRRWRMEDFLPHHNSEYEPGIYLAEEVLTRGVNNIISAYKAFMENRRYEGVVLKSQTGKMLKSRIRSSKRIKVKRFITLDMLIVGFFYNKIKKKPTRYLLALQGDDTKFYPCAVVVVLTSLENELNQYCMTTKTLRVPKDIVPYCKPDYWTSSMLVVEVETDGLREKDFEKRFPNVGWTLHNYKQRVIISIRRDKSKYRVNTLGHLMQLIPAPGSI